MDQIRSIQKGEVLAEEPMSSIMSYSFEDIDEFNHALEAARDKKEYLQHCMPSAGGKIYEQKMDHWYAFLNHCDNPNLEVHTKRFDAKNIMIKAIRDIIRGEELTGNYDEFVGYERHGREEIMIGFLALCEKHGVEKRPSQLTLPPIMVTGIK